MLWNNEKKWKLTIILAAVALVVFSCPIAAGAQDVNFVGDPNLPEEPQIPGRIEGTGTYFEVTDSNYLNITFESSEPVNLRLESVPEMVVMDIEAAEGATSTQITLTGFAPSTTYYKYEDDYHNEVSFTTDANGSYSYTQDLTDAHHVFIQPSAGTWYIPTSTSIGTWDPVNRIYTLTTDVYETIQIDEDNLTLDGVGHTVTGPGVYGIYLSGRTGLTIKNLNIQRGIYGIYMLNSSHNTLTDNTITIPRLPDAYGIGMSNCNNNTLVRNTITLSAAPTPPRGYAGIMLWNCSDNALTANTVSGVSSGEGQLYFGIMLGDYSSGNILENNTLSDCGDGIYLRRASGNTLTGNIASNKGCGIYLVSSSGSTLIHNTTSNNGTGIYLHRSGNSTLTDNSAILNRSHGILLGYSDGSTLTGNTMVGNGYNFSVYGGPDFDNDIDTSNLVDGKPVYYVKNAVGNVYDSSTNAGVFYAINCDNITIKDLTLTNNYYGVFLWNTHNSRIENVKASNNRGGIVLVYSNNNTVTGNTTVSNEYAGISIYGSNNTITANTVVSHSNSIYSVGISLSGSHHNNAVIGNTLADNSRGITLSRSSYNEIYNNNFIDNSVQAYVYLSSGNIFNLDKPIGGNYWSDWTSPDDDGDGFVDNAYPIYDEDGNLAAQDNLPWVYPLLTPGEAVHLLTVQVEVLNLDRGIDNNLDAKLGAAEQALDDINQNNDIAAVNTLQAFINAVEAQSGNKISTEDADAIIATAQEIIAVLSGT